MKNHKKFLAGMAGGLLALGALAVAVGSTVRVSTGAASPLPFSKEVKTISYLCKPNAEISRLCDGDLNKLPFYQELEKRTNIHVDWAYSMEEIDTDYQLGQSKIPSPDIIDQYNLQYIYPIFLDDYIDNGIIMDLSDLVEKFAPHYYQLIQQPEYKKIAYTPSGRIAAIYSLKKEAQSSFGGLMLRKDWLMELGLDLPVTYDDWEKMLMAFKEKEHVVAPLFLPATGYNIDGSLNVGFGVAQGLYHVEDKVYYGPAENEWKEYLMLMHKWYKKGLIDPQFASGTTTCMQEDLMATGAVGAGMSLYTIPSKLTFDQNNQDADFVAVPPPKKKAGDQLHFAVDPSYYDNYMTISADCQNPALVLTWMDYLFSEEGALLANYGIENDTFAWNEEGQPVYTDKILHHPDGLTFIDALKTYTFPQGNASAYIDWKREWQAVSEEDIRMCDVWQEGNGDSAWTWPDEIKYTSEEAIRLADLSGKIYATVDKYTVDFIMGTKSFDQYQDYMDELKDNGLNEFLKIHEAAYIRYLKER